MLLLVQRNSDDALSVKRQTDPVIDLCAMLITESTQELDAVLDKIRVIKGVVDTFSTIMLSTKLDRPE